DRGQEGLELAFDEWLRGKPGAKRVIRDRHGRIVENIDLVRAAEPGKDLVLSIDRRIQFLVYRELRNALEKHKAASGSAVVLDVATGEVLAMVNLPSYNPNAVTGGNPDSRRNRVVTDLIEPGSTMKPITAAAALSAGKVHAATKFDTSPGYMGLGRFTIRDHRNYGVLDVTGIITKSSNLGAVMLAQPLDDQYFYDFIRGFGFGSPPRSGFPGEAAGVLRPPARWDGLTKATMSYGYGLSVTPLQIAQAYAALGNHGRLTPPTFVKGQINESRQVVAPEIADQVVRMMQTVTEPGGTATQAAILGYHVAGKTGTARHASGVGGNDREAGSDAQAVAAGHVFRAVLDDARRVMVVAPDDIDTWLAAQAKGEAKRGAALAPFPEAIDDPGAEDPTLPPAMSGVGGLP